LPFVLINMSMTADGKIATANRTVTSFGSTRDLRNLYSLRATADAVMCGARTANTPGVALDVGGPHYRRLRQMRGLKPELVRVLVTGSGALKPDAGVFTLSEGPTVILTTTRAAPRRIAALQAVASDVHISAGRGVDWVAALSWLRARWGVNRLLCEGGGELNAALFQARLVDELHLTICPFLFGGRAAPTMADGLGARRLAQAVLGRLTSCRRQSDEMFLVYSFT
jgi:riboflavin-specific deaminase-like protein